MVGLWAPISQFVSGLDLEECDIGAFCVTPTSSLQQAKSLCTDKTNFLYHFISFCRSVFSLHTHLPHSAQPYCLTDKLKSIRAQRNLQEERWMKAGDGSH